MQSVLFHLGLLDRLPVRGNGRAGRRAADWARITERAPTIAATINDYLDQMSVRLRPNSLRTIDTSLRLFAGYLVDHHPDVTAIAAVRRTHVQGYKSWLAARHGHRGPVLANQTLRGRLGTLAAFFARLEELDITDAPTRSPVLRSDLPIKDDPLPRFIDDAASTKLHAAAQAHPDLFTRTAVELLARTGTPQERTPRPDRRRGRADRFVLLAADPGRQTAHRPVCPAAPATQDAARSMARPTR